MDYFSAIKRYRSAYKNWLWVIIGSALRLEPLNANLRNGKTLKLNHRDIWAVSLFIASGLQVEDIKPESADLIYKGRKLNIHGWNSGGIWSSFSDYGWVQPKGRRVLDIGASIGDSAIFFVLNGAQSVCALEPYPYPFRLAQMNLRSNGIENVTLINAGVGRSECDVMLTMGETNSSSRIRPQSKEGISVPMHKLDWVIENYGPFDTMKMDCEGCEYDAILESAKIKEIPRIQLEYHYGFESLKQKFQCEGYEVRTTKSRRVNDHGPLPEMHIGYLYAVKS